MTQEEVEDPKQSLSVEDELARKRKVKAKAIDISAKNPFENFIVSWHKYPVDQFLH
ncbi:MAG: hypothetical protein WA667_13235 [Candidatus Nitrosopolaris sp.]